MKAEDVKARKFKRGLRHSISTPVVLHKYSTYAEVTQATKVIEDQQRENYRAIQAGKRPMSSSGYKGPCKFQRDPTLPPLQLSTANLMQPRHPRQLQSLCGTQTLTCYNCNEARHMIRDCPCARQGNSWPTVSSKAPQAKTVVCPPLPSPANRTQGRVYSVTNEEAHVDPGMISVCSQLAYVLFDLGVTHSFISPSFAKKMPIKPKQMAQNLMVSTLMGSKVELNMIYAPCPVRVCDRELTTSLIVLDIKDFSVILGMDWLSAQGANLIYVE
ncbi:uncharacterized protein LOC122655284 [Telopea speciosissima]|uniref:uncharacterized protein LOC122655284 n=1 Tax=Telopea speciosissima TaxID=54955 RepID=UPI001CC37BD6|nr:uncharacterized protein LOC122655284 [Telopea speciosissima]